MTIDNVLSQAVLGIQRGLRGAQEHAAQIANAGQFSNNQTNNLAESMTGLRQDRVQVQASVAVVKAYDAMIGSLFDEKV